MPSPQPSPRATRGPFVAFGGGVLVLELKAFSSIGVRWLTGLPRHAGLDDGRIGRSNTLFRGAGAAIRSPEPPAEVLCAIFVVDGRVAMTSVEDARQTLEFRVCRGPLKPGRSRSLQPSVPGRLNGYGSGPSGRLHLRPTGRRVRRLPGPQPRVREDLLDDRLLQDRRNDLELAAAAQAMIQVEVEHALEQVGPAQPHWAGGRTGRLALDGRPRPGLQARALAASPARASGSQLLG